MSVCVQHPYPCTLATTPPQWRWCRAGLLEAYVTRKPAEFLTKLYYQPAPHMLRGLASLSPPFSALLRPLRGLSLPQPDSASIPSSSPSFLPSSWRGCGPTRSWWTCCRTPSWSRGRGATGGTGGEEKERGKGGEEQMRLNTFSQGCKFCLNLKKYMYMIYQFTFFVTKSII